MVASSSKKKSDTQAVGDPATVAAKGPSLAQVDTLLKQIQELRSQVAERPAEPEFVPPDPDGTVDDLLYKHLDRLHQRLKKLELNCGMNPHPHPMEEDEVHEEFKGLAPRCASHDPIYRPNAMQSRRRRPIVRKHEETPESL